MGLVESKTISTLPIIQSEKPQNLGFEVTYSHSPGVNDYWKTVERFLATLPIDFALKNAFILVLGFFQLYSVK